MSLAGDVDMKVGMGFSVYSHFVAQFGQVEGGQLGENFWTRPAFVDEFEHVPGP